ncbi:hypothetical protein D3C84_760360 [compost metagenome]
MNAHTRQFTQPLPIDLRREFAGTEDADMQRCIQLGGKVLELAVQGLPSIDWQEVQIIKLHRQIPAADG